MTRVSYSLTNVLGSNHASHMQQRKKSYREFTSQLNPIRFGGLVSTAAREDTGLHKKNIVYIFLI